MPPTRDFNFPADVQIILAIATIAGLAVAVIGVVLTIQLSPRKSNEAPRVGRPLHPIRFWRPSQYALALGHLQKFQERLAEDTYSKGMERGYVTESDLVRWVVQLALTCAAQMVPQSLGKANLFRVSQIVSNGRGHTTAISLYSSDLVGVFSVNQLTNWMNPTELRNLASAEGQDLSRFPAALQCCVDGIPLLQSLRRRKASFDEPEASARCHPHTCYSVILKPPFGSRARSSRLHYRRSSLQPTRWMASGSSGPSEH